MNANEALEKHASGESLAGAYLEGADLSSADLTGADLRGAKLRGADLEGANLEEANLSGADLTGACLAGADLSGACLTGACLVLVNLAGANLYLANLSETNLTGAILPEMIPVVQNIDRAVLAAVSATAKALNMGAWHTCTTTHCRAGWHVHLAGDAGYALEAKVGPSAAGALIYAASIQAKRGSGAEVVIPDFYASNEEALLDIQARAGV